MRFPIPIIAIVFFFSCCNTWNKENVPTIDLSGKFEPTIEVKLSEIADQIKIIFLETNENCLIGNIRNIHVTDKYILITDRSLFKILLFTRQGKFLRSIGSRGQGPGEYLQVIDCCFSPSTDEILVLCNTTNERMTYFYDLDGTLNKTVPSENNPTGIASLGTSIVYHHGLPNNFLYNNGYSLVTINNKSEVNYLLKRTQQYPGMSLFLHVFHMTQIDNYLSIWEGYYDTIYYINNSLDVLPKFTIQHGEDYIFADGPVPMHEYNQKRRSSSSITNLMDSRDYIFIARSVKTEFRNEIFVKNSSQIFHLAGRYILNDIAGPRNFWPYTVIQDNLVCGVYQISELKENVEKYETLNFNDPLQNDLFVKNLDKASLYDNQCILLVNLKKSYSGTK